MDATPPLDYYRISWCHGALKARPLAPPRITSQLIGAHANGFGCPFKALLNNRFAALASRRPPTIIGCTQQLMDFAFDSSEGFVDVPRIAETILTTFWVSTKPSPEFETQDTQSSFR